ncbi:MAG TPA: pantoate--beta-alanine ligase [Rhodanobacteraceae bacterium]|nr:pantoate--beta-alanine ligase [Rhodanobacteraceae bacterium]
MPGVADAAALRAALGGWRARGERVALVPTMGNLHAGHFSLLDLARNHAARVVVSVFVNPTQFGPGEDFSRYPRTLAEDRAGLARHGCDLLFAPAVETMYPLGLDAAVRVHVPGLSEVLEGAQRPGHFDGVATVVARLFNLVQPDVAVFGRKDYQQFLVLQRMVRDLAWPIELLTAPIVREPDGLAMSSRNRYLDADQRARASVIHATLGRMRESLVAGAPYGEVEAAACSQLEDAGLACEYAVVRNARDLSLPTDAAPRVALIAARLGSTRLIDNLEV